MIPSNSIFLSVPGWATPAILFPSGSAMPLSITGIKTSPPLPEEASIGSNVVYFWVDGSAINPLPKAGDQLNLDNTLYDIERTAVDLSGQQGVLLVLRHA